MVFLSHPVVCSANKCKPNLRVFIRQLNVLEKSLSLKYTRYKPGEFLIKLQNRFRTSEKNDGRCSELSVPGDALILHN